MVRCGLPRRSAISSRVGPPRLRQGETKGEEALSEGVAVVSWHPRVPCASCSDVEARF